jgi:hypothetical protein
LPITVAPLNGETLPSYLKALTRRNYLRPGWLTQQVRGAEGAPRLARLTGYPTAHLISALPALRTPASLHRHPHLLGTASARAPTRPACRRCLAAHRRAGEAVTVHAGHQQVLCTRHRRWLGAGLLHCPAAQQFSIGLCPEILRAHRWHRILLRRWGAGPTAAAFTDAWVCVSQWSRWPAVTADPGVQSRWQAFGITDVDRPLGPREVAALYPNTVALTGLLLDQRRQIAAEGAVTAEIMQHGLAILARRVFTGLQPGGAADLFRHAVLAQRPDPDTELEHLDTAPPPLRVTEGDNAALRQ